MSTFDGQEFEEGNKSTSIVQLLAKKIIELLQGLKERHFDEIRKQQKTGKFLQNRTTTSGFVDDLVNLGRPKT